MAFEEEDYRSSLSLKTWAGIFSFLRGMRGRFAALIALMVSVAAVDASLPFLTGWVVDEVIRARDPGKLLPFLALYLPLILAQTCMVKLFMGFGGKVEMGLNYEIRKTAFSRLQELSFSYFDRTSSGWLQARLTSDINRLADTVAWGMVDVAWGGMMMLGMAVLMLLRDWRLALVTLSVAPLLVIVSVKFEEGILDRVRGVRRQNSRVTAAFSEGIRGMQTVKALGSEERMNGDFSSLTGRLRLLSVSASRLSSLYLPLVVAIGWIGASLSLGTGAAFLRGGSISYGTLVAFILSALQFYDPVTDLARVFADFQYGQASAERVLSLIRSEPEIGDSEAVRAASGDFDPSGASRPPLEGRISFRNVSFSYRGGRPVLSDFSLEIPAGSTVALVGETGSGKSTVVNLACRFYEPTSGSILIDGVDYRERSLKWLHSRLGYVLQSPYLFSGSVRENIRYGRLDATDAAVEEAARAAGAEGFISRLSAGYDTEVGEGGKLLSTGQKQLISFARALLADPRILVLDEATSSVDTETERLIQDATATLLAGRTCFVVAHRLSTIMDADRILVLSAGKVVESGTHAELMAARGSYHRLFTNQFLEERESGLLSGREGGAA